jgi:hypothetical protein
MSVTPTSPSSNSGNFAELVRDEMKRLHEDIQDLKRCQIGYFSLSLTGTGAILGFAASLKEDTGLRWLTVLVPLVIVLPCWIIFFDKATSVTRNTGYLRHLEAMLGGKSAQEYVGFQSSLSKYRDLEDNIWHEQSRGGRCKRVRAFIGALMPMWFRHRYWVINWYTFLALSLSCCISSYVLYKADTKSVGNRAVVDGSAFFLVFIVFCYTLVILYHLVGGRQSYDNCSIIWGRIFAGPTAEPRPPRIDRIWKCITQVISMINKKWVEASET